MQGLLHSHCPSDLWLPSNISGAQVRKVDHESLQLWVGRHRRIGLVIFDVTTQARLPEAEVRLFKVSERSTGTFLKSVVKGGLIALDEATWLQAQSGIADYVKMMTNRRATHCFDCKSDLNSVDFSLCPTCRWIKCHCGGCGCNYTGRDTDAT